MSEALDLFGGPVAGPAEVRAVSQGAGGVPVRTTQVQMQVHTQVRMQVHMQVQARVRISVQTGFQCAVQVVGPLVGLVVGP